MSSYRSVWATNAAANVLSGVMGALVSLILPAILARYLTKNEFLLWNLSFPMVAYAQALAIGVMTTVSRCTATTLYGEKGVSFNRVASGGLLVWVVASFAMLLVTIFYAFGYPLFVKDISQNLIKEFSLCVLILGCAAILQSASLMFAGIFIGNQKNIYWAYSQVISKAVLLAGVFFVAIYSVALFSFVSTYAISSLVVVPVSYFFLVRYFPSFLDDVVKAKRDWGDLRKMLKMYGVFSVLNINVLIVSVLSTTFVGYFEFDMVTPFALSVTVVNVLVGVSQAILAPISPQFIRLKLQDSAGAALALAGKVVIYVIYGFATVIFIYAFFGESLLSVWVGSNYAHAVYPLLGWLLVATAIRNACLPLSMLMLGLGASRSNLIPAFSESFAYLISSIAFGAFLGGKGILVGAIIGAIVSVAAYGFVLRSEFSLIDIKGVLGKLRYQLIFSLSLAVVSIFLVA